MLGDSKDDQACEWERCIWDKGMGKEPPQLAQVVHAVAELFAKVIGVVVVLFVAAALPLLLPRLLALGCLLLWVAPVVSPLPLLS